MASIMSTYLGEFGYKEWWEFMTNSITRPRRAEYPDMMEAGPQLSATIAKTSMSATTLANVCEALNEILFDFHQHRNEVLLWLNEEWGCREVDDLNEDDGLSEDGHLSSAASSDSDDAEQVIVPWDFDREEEALLSNFVYLWRRENGVGDSLQLTFDNDSSSPDLESTAGLHFTFRDCREYFAPEYSEQLQRFNNLNTSPCSGAGSITFASSTADITSPSPSSSTFTSTPAHATAAPAGLLSALPAFRTATSSSDLLAGLAAAASTNNTDNN